MKILFTAALLLLMTVSKLSCFSVLHAPEPVCRKIPHEICKQVSRTRYESVIRKECHSVPDNVCAEWQERKCSFTQRPVQENVDTNFISCLGWHRRSCYRDLGDLGPP